MNDENYLENKRMLIKLKRMKFLKKKEIVSNKTD